MALSLVQGGHFREFFRMLCCHYFAGLDIKEIKVNVHEVKEIRTKRFIDEKNQMNEYNI
jgi:hypothetical protein